MRIIAGEFRGRRLVAPAGQATRPMLDRARESLFGTLGDLVPGARVLDLFAGSGALGLEALSRGAERVRFVERAGPALQALRRNLETLGLARSPAAEVYAGGALSPDAWRAADGAPWDLVLFDPPYPWLQSSDRRLALFAAVAELLGEHVAPGGLLVFHTPKSGVAASDFARGLVAERRVVGSTALWLVEAGEAPGGAADPGEAPGPEGAETPGGAEPAGPERAEAGGR